MSSLDNNDSNVNVKSVLCKLKFPIGFDEKEQKTKQDTSR